LLGLQGDRAWPGLMRAIGRPELIGDPRYESHSKRYQHARELVAMLDQIFATKTLAEWGAIFDREDVWWCPVQSAAEVMNDPQAEGAGLFVDVPKPEGGVMRQPAGPVDFYGTPWHSRSVAPEFGQDTENVLLEMGRSWEDIARLKSEGVIP
ncbi:MAG TPA: CoA transferase, partial [Candidatus Binataceae bacterium]